MSDTGENTTIVARESDNDKSDIDNGGSGNDTLTVIRSEKSPPAFDRDSSNDLNENDNKSDRENDSESDHDSNKQKDTDRHHQNHHQQDDRGNTLSKDLGQSKTRTKTGNKRRIDSGDDVDNADTGSDNGTNGTGSDGNDDYSENRDDDQGDDNDSGISETNKSPERTVTNKRSASSSMRQAGSSSAAPLPRQQKRSRSYSSTRDENHPHGSVSNANITNTRTTTTTTPPPSSTLSQTDRGGNRIPEKDFSLRTRRGRDLKIRVTFGRPLVLKQMIGFFAMDPKGGLNRKNDQNNQQSSSGDDKRILITVIDERDQDSRRSDEAHVLDGESLFDDTNNNSNGNNGRVAQKPFVGIAIEQMVNSVVIAARVKAKEPFYVKQGTGTGDENEGELYCFLMNGVGLQNMIQIACDDTPPPESIELALAPGSNVVEITRYEAGTDMVSSRARLPYSEENPIEEMKQFQDMREAEKNVAYYYTLQNKVSKLKKFLQTLSKRGIRQFKFEIAEPANQFKNRGAFQENPLDWSFVFVALSAWGPGGDVYRMCENILIVPPISDKTPEERALEVEEHRKDAMALTRDEFAITMRAFFNVDNLKVLINQMNDRHQLEIHANLQERMLKFVYYCAEENSTPDRSEFLWALVQPVEPDEEADKLEDQAAQTVPIYVRDFIY